MTSHVARFGSSHWIAARYALGALALAVLACFTGWWALLPGWIALALAIMAASYRWIGPRVYRKRDGRIPLWIRVLLWPHVLGLDVVRRWQFRRMKRAWDEICPGVILGRLLRENEAQHAIEQCRVTAVLDVSAEHAEAAACRALTYRNVPVLDLLPPSVADLRAAAEFIAEHAPSGCVYVHCGLGKARGAAAVAAFLIHSGRAPTASEACEIVLRARPRAKFSEQVRQHLEALANTHDSLHQPASLIAVAPSASV
jgi:hypothetical protein